MGLDAQQTTYALGIAGSQAAGMQQNRGTGVYSEVSYFPVNCVAHLYAVKLLNKLCAYYIVYNRHLIVPS